MKVLIVGDIHLSDRPPSVRTSYYTEQVLDKVRHTVSVARERDVDAVVWAGDVFHIKAPSRTSHALVRAVADIGQSYPCPWLIVPGNHDMSHDRIESLPSQPLGVLFRAGAQCLDGGHEDLPLFGVPYLKNWERDLPGILSQWEHWESFEPSLMVTHAPIVPPGVELPYETIDVADWVHRWDPQGTASLYYGHMHHCDGAYEVTPSVWACNQGALSRGSLHEDDLSRKPAVTVWHSDRDEPFERVEVPHLPSEEVFWLSDAEDAKERAIQLDDFVTALGSRQLGRVSIEAVVADLSERDDVDEDVLTEARECVEVAVDRT